MANMQQAPRFSIVIPAHNEELRIVATLTAYAEAFGDSELIVVLNDCTDRTSPLVDLIRAKYSNVDKIEIKHAVGKGGAIRAGFLVARAPAVAYVDADGATSAAELRRLCESLGQDDALIASRWCSGSTIAVRQPWTRLVASRIFNMIVRLLFGLPFTDTQCGAKVFRTEAIRSILDRIETSNFAFDVDALFALKNAKLRVKEVGTVWNDVAGSRLNLMTAAFPMLAAIVRLRIRYSFFQLVIPAFDKVFPTGPIKAHRGFSILILNWRDPLHPQAGGAETYLHEIAKRWIKSGHEIEWLTASFPGAKKTEVLDGMRITRVGNAFTVYAALPIKYLTSFRDRFDCVIDSENGIPFFSPLFSMKPNICVMHHVHRTVFRTQLAFPISTLFVWIESWLMPRIYRRTAFITVSNDTKREMEDLNISKNPIRVITNGVDPNLRPGKKAAAPTILYLGRLKPYKRVHLLITALQRVLETVPDATLRIAGAGDARESLEALVAQLHLEDKVRFDGFVDAKSKLRLLQEAWVFASASLMEGWGISVIEANACGTASVAFAVPGLRESIIDGYNGVLVGKKGDLAKSIVRILTDAPYRADLERNAVARAREFSWDRSAQEMLDQVLHHVAGNRLSLVRLGDHWQIVKRGDLLASRESQDTVLERIPILLESTT